ncbi:DUF805 domain-containing protein [Brevundimonas sp. Root1279]|uniref:DUF805 domain-containing protein n=1 Tax=Brevundimonas sp. Root1279 TaxID=1736443 RepID=UPI0006FC2B70|nr:DUF805 domain-containing protein [Brevundimonas sp. Root1279]KQW82219.1 hypothetical protein ASC65_08030 [Brevundimonas sp. Root1279]
MQGEIVSVDAVTGDGRILAADGRELSFRAASCTAPVEVGQSVDYVEIVGDVAGEITPAGKAFRFAKQRPARAPGALDWGSLFLTSEGRLRRLHYWIGMAILLVVSRLLGPVPLIGAVVGLVAFILCFALQARRLRDIGQSAWWLLIPLGVWIAGWFLTMNALRNFSPASSLGILSLSWATLFVPAVIVVLGLIPGQRGRNRFGPDTKPAPPEATAATFA